VENSCEFGIEPSGSIKRWENSVSATHKNTEAYSYVHQNIFLKEIDFFTVSLLRKLSSDFLVTKFLKFLLVNVLVDDLRLF
jgi:hypothetical protein